MVHADAASRGNNGQPLEGCLSLGTLYHILHKKKAYYKSNKTHWNSQQGLPEVRNQMISAFKRLRGFHFLSLFLERRAVLPKEQQILQTIPQQQQQQQQQPSPPSFPFLDNIQIILEALKDSIPLPSERSNEQTKEESKHTEDLLRICNAIKSHLQSLDEETLKRINPDAIKGTMYQLQRLYDKLALSYPPLINEYYDFSRSLVLKLITSASLPLKLLGWTALEEIIDASIEKRPPPKAYLVEGAGLEFINGRFDYDPKKLTEGGWVKNDSDVSYVRKIPENSGNPATSEDGAGKTLTLFRCTMRSQQKWWFISEADEDQPGTDKDIDYYQHKSKQIEEGLPSAYGWVTCRSGVDPPPTLRAVGLMVPLGEEENTLECVLAKWAIENGVIELVLGDSIHREIVARSTALIKFLASMCDNDDGSVNVGEDGENVVASPMETEKIPNPYCLKLSHLLLAWKTCTSKTDAAVSAEIYNLLVSILPSLPEDLAIPLLQAIRAEVNKGNHNFFEVSEFCCAIANIAEGYYKNNNPMNIKTRVREEILGLQWAILTHEDARTLKSYENIRKYVSGEIRQNDTVAQEMRHRFLLDCREMLKPHLGGESSAAVTNETHALHMVQLVRFVLASYPRRSAEGLVMIESDGKEVGPLADLLLLELIAFLGRGRSAMTAPPMRKVSNTAGVGFSCRCVCIDH
jgi:ubiquitin carboxyl-terminal hydrolase 9/24